MNILVLGRHGQLGQSLEDILPKTYPNSIFWIARVWIFSSLTTLNIN